MATLTSLLNIVKVALGLGFVIFLHELGHFLLAKWNGVKVEKFSIGFGWTLFGFRRGETEYVIAAIPLGGFVKMLGEGAEDEPNATADPRAYSNKSVWARMAIISAGVIMNVFLGLACFVYAFGQGMDEIPPLIGGVLPGSPAYAAGFRSGDEIVSIDGRRDISFNTMRLIILLSGAGQKVHFEVKRPGVQDLVPIDVEPKRNDSSPVPSIGVGPARSLKLADPPFLAPAGMAVEKGWKSGLRTNDLLVAFGPAGEEAQPIKEGDDWQRRMVAARSRPLAMVFERRPEPIEGRKAQPETVKVTLPPEHMVDFGFRLTIDPIAAIRPGSPAEKAGFRVGDRIVKVDTKDDLDPMRLPEYCDQRAGQTISFEVERTSAGNDSQRQVIEVAADSTPLPLDELLVDELMEIPNVGFAYPVRAKIASVVPGSPAEKAGFKAGDEFTHLTIPPTPGEKKARARTTEFTQEGRGWPGAFYRLQIEPTGEVEIAVKGKVKAIAVRPEPVQDWYNPRRGLFFQELIRRLPPQGIASSLRRGTDDTIDNILRIYAMLRSLAQKRVSPKLLGGPLMIAQVAYTQAETGLTEFVHFLGILSINLAVLNFLPMPPLDGGQMVFLIAEKVRGRPLPASAQNVVIWIGVILLICLMVYVLFQDVVRTFFAS